MTSNPGPMFAEEQGTSAVGSVWVIWRGHGRTYDDHGLIASAQGVEGSGRGNQSDERFFGDVWNFYKVFRQPRGLHSFLASHALPVSRDTPKSGPKINVFFILTSIAVEIEILQFYRG